MGLTPTTLTAVQQLFAIERQINKKATNLIKQASPLLYFLMGKQEPVITPMPKRQGSTVPLSGNYHELKFMVEPEVITPVLTNTDAMSVVTPIVNEDAYSGARVKSTLYSHTHWISDLDTFAVDGADISKGEKFVQSELDRIMASIEKELATATYSSNGQSRSALSGLEHWVDEASVLGIDGFTINRALPENAATRSYVDSTSAAISEQRIFKAKAAVGIYKGTTEFAVSDYITYAAVHDAFNDKDELVLNNDPWLQYGGEWVRYGKTVFAPDAYAPAAKLFGIDGDAVEWGMSRSGITASSFVDDMRIRAGKAAKVQVGAVLVVPDPRRCWKIENITFS